MPRQRPPRSQPYLAPKAPSSPLLLVVAGVIVALLARLCVWLDVQLPVDLDTVTVAAVLSTVWGAVQNHLARGEQARGVSALEALRAPEPTSDEGSR